MQKVLAIVGPTASGKSALAIKLAKKINGEIISADSRQVYKELNLISGKVTRKEMAGIPHHLLSVISLKKSFSVAQYKILAEKAIEDILKRNKVPILCGGTGFYLQAVIDNVSLPEVQADLSLRKKLENKSLTELFLMLKKLDPKRAESIDSKNKVRLIRAIEIAKALGKVPSLKTNPKYDVIQVGVDISSEKLKLNINKRLKARMKAGMIAEAKKIHKSGVSFKRLKELGLECRYLALFLEKKITKQEMLTQIETESFKYAKRQMTWFRKDKRVKWFGVKNQKDFKTIVEEVKSFLS